MTPVAELMLIATIAGFAAGCIILVAAMMMGY